MGTVASFFNEVARDLRAMKEQLSGKNANRFSERSFFRVFSSESEIGRILTNRSKAAMCYLDTFSSKLTCLRQL